MKKLNPEYIKRVNQMVNRSPYFELLSMQIRDVGLGFSVLEIDLAEKHLQPFGLVHGGVFASIIDAAAFWALFYEIEDQDAGATTVDLKLYRRVIMTKDVKEGYGWSQEMSISLHDKLKKDLKEAMLQKEPEVRNTMRQIMAEFPKLTVPLILESGKKSTRLKKPVEITDDDILGIIKGLVKSEQTVLEFKKEETSEYLEILQSYLPATASREEIAAWIQANIDFSQYKNKMQAMGPVMKHFGKLADGKQVNQILKEWEL